MKHTYLGSCQCNRIEVKIELTQEIDNYAPRACDCDFCMAHNAQYISDPKGQITISPKDHLVVKKHGSEQAEFHLCSQCNTLVAVTCNFDSGLKGALNSVNLAQYTKAQTSTSVSPKLLSADEKKSRWEHIWTNTKLMS